MHVLDIQSPRMTYEPADDTLGRFEVEPLDRGFGHTFGNSLRRVLLSSLEGAAVTSVRIEGVQHEFTTIPGVREDVTDIILNLRELVCRLHGEIGEIEVELSKVGPGEVTAADISAPADLEILNPELEIANLEAGARLDMILIDHARPRLRAGRAEQGPGHDDRGHPGRLELLAGPPGALRGEPRPRRPAHRLRQALARDPDRRQRRPAGRDGGGRRDAHRAARDLRRPRQHPDRWARPRPRSRRRAAGCTTS